jgi:hypothetical protein
MKEQRLSIGAVAYTLQELFLRLIQLGVSSKGASLNSAWPNEFVCKSRVSIAVSVTEMQAAWLTKTKHQCSPANKRGTHRTNNSKEEVPVASKSSSCWHRICIGWE